LKILFFTRYTRQGASSRLRFYQYIPIYESLGFQCEISPLFDEKYLDELYGNKSISKTHILWRYLIRFVKLFKTHRYDLLVVEKELFPYLPAFIERILSAVGTRYIVDYDDAIFHNYDLHPNKYIRCLLSNKIAQVMKYSAAVVAGNDYLHAYALKSGATSILIIPTVIDTSLYKLKDSKTASDVVIGWIGSPSTLQYVKLLKPVLEEINNIHPIKLHIIGGKSGVGLGNIEQVLEWTEDGEVEMIRQLDIGIMPLKDELWEYGKCGYKLIQYMGCGIPVVGSPIGVNDQIIQEGVNGFKPTDTTAWKEAFQKLIKNEELRHEMGVAGRMIVEERYSLTVAGKRWVSLLESFKN
jgi:glycosyltransferase involved in cell wall biosynthesis